MDRIETENNMPSKAVQTAARTAMIMAVLLLCSKLFGFVREMIMAAYFGTSYVVDAYVMAQSIPNMLFAGIFGAVATAYMPLLSEKIEQGSQEDGNSFTSRVINILLVLSAISAVIGLTFSDQLTALMANGFTGETAALTSSYLKITFAYVMFSSTAGILEAYLQYKGTFIPQVVIGYTQNIIMIVTIIISAYTNYHFLAFGLLIAYIVKLILMYCLSRKREFRYSLRRGNYSETFKSIMPLAIPVFIGYCGTQINMFVDKYLASGLVEGSVSALNYGNILNGIIMTLSTSVLSTIIYPKLNQSNASGNRDSVISISKAGVNLTILIALPFAFGAIVYSGEIVQIIFERGAFDATATSLTQGAYKYYSVGMMFMALNTLLSGIYFSVKDTRRPMYFSMAGVVANIVINLLLIGPMKHEGLALATSCAAIVNTLLLSLGLRKFHEINVIPSLAKFVKLVLTTGISVGGSLLCYKGLVAAIWMPRMVYLGIAVVIAVLLYLVLLKIFKVEELALLTSIIKRHKTE